MIGMGILQPVVALAAWTMVMWAWMYGTRIPAMNRLKVDPDVGLRVVHSLVQAISNKVVVRFVVFVLSSLVLLALIVHAAIAVF
jgi:hypothetical protein